MRFCWFDWQHFQDAAVKSGRSPSDPHVPPFATYELGVLYAQDEKVSKMPLILGCHISSNEAMLIEKHILNFQMSAKGEELLKRVKVGKLIFMCSLRLILSSMSARLI